MPSTDRTNDVIVLIFKVRKGVAQTESQTNAFQIKFNLNRRHRDCLIEEVVARKSISTLRMAVNPDRKGHS